MSNQKRDDFIKNYRILNNNLKNNIRYMSKVGTSKEYAKRVNENPGLLKNIANRLGKKGIVISLATVLVASGIPIIAHNYFRRNSDSIAIEDVIKNGKDMEKLGILQEDYEELEKIKNDLNNSEIEDSSLMEYRDRLEKLSLKIGKRKISSCLQDIDAERINFINNEATNSLPAWQAVVIRDESTKYDNYDADGIGYLDYACSSLPDSKHRIDDNIASYISTIIWIQGAENPTLDDLKKIVKNIEQFTCLDVVFKDGNFETNSDRIQEVINKLDFEENER